MVKEGLFSMKNNKDKSILKMNKDFFAIYSIYRRLNDTRNSKNQLVPASEWLLDNFYIIEEHAKQIKRDFNKKIYVDLPIVSSGYTRVFTIAREIVEKNDGKIDENIIENFIKKYEEVTPLYMREIWNLGVTLRISLIEKIRKISEEIVRTYNKWEQAEKWLEDYNKNSELRLPGVDDNYSFYEHLAFKLRRMGKDGIIVLNRIDNYIEKYGTSIEAISRKEHSIQAEMKISIGNSIQSLKYISNINWNELFNKISEIENIFNTEKSGIYPKMDLESKNAYRSKVEKIAKTFKISELHVAKKCVTCADKNCDGEKAGHIGYYLLDEGREVLIENLDVKVPVLYKLKNFFIRNPFPIYLSTMILFALISTVLLYLLFYFTTGITRLSYIGLVVGFIIAFDGGVCFANYLFSRIFKPRVIPRLDYMEGIPENSATMVIVPTLLSSKKRVSDMLSNLEKYFVAVSSENVFFTLVGDAKESETEDIEEDEEIVKEGISTVNRLNEKYGAKKFFFVYRKRFFNASEEKWLGWERKRGAILKFNEFLIDGKKEDYRCVSDGFNTLPKIKYVLTVDADTIIPINEARKLIGAISHPVNKPVLNEEETAVVSGYGLIQPHIGIDVVSANQSKFSQVFAGTGGIDPYVCASSDIYQDLFGEAIFTGKGIYDLEIFQKVLKDTLPDNAILSHDLLEGSYLRAGLATDIELIDGYPSRYNAYAMRAHRWIRGDWQILPWMFGKVKNRANETIKNPINKISKWKIFDNLRRSLTAPFMMLLIFLAFGILPGNPLIWTAFAVILGIRGNKKQFLYQFLFLPFQAWLMFSAICITLYRMAFIKKNLLEWVTAADMETKLKNTLGSFYFLMKSNLVQGIVIFLLAYFVKGDRVSIITGLFLFAVWAISPIIAFYISKPRHKKNENLSDDEKEELKIFAKNTWSYFETLMNAENNFLPPDNFQEDPPNGVAYRTSPTNIGLGMLAILSAYDLGFIDKDELIDRFEKILNTIEKLEKWNGHLLNWYNTKTLKPLFPKYISTVDNGNFLAYAITAREGIKEILCDKGEKKEEFVEKLEQIIIGMDFSILYDKKKNVFSIGYNLEEGRLTNSYYDLLASEARQTSFLAVARHESPVKHWFSLGRSLTKLNGHKGLVSWTGTMFEYLMPLLVMKNYYKTLLDETYDFVIESQMIYAKKKNVVWGISESAFYNFDINLNYQYKALGVPWLGLKRGLIDDTVISPYSTMLALMVKPKEAYKNLKAMLDFNMFGKFGFYEAIDFTPGRLKFITGDKNYAQIKSYMAHHQGMSLVAINNVINNFVMQERFHRDVYVESAEVLLQEKVPGDIIYTKDSKEKVVPPKQVVYESIDTDREIDIRENIRPEFNVLTNGSYSVRINDRGIGVSQLRNVSISRYRSDYLNEIYGQVFYIRCINTGEIWSPTYLPYFKKPDKYMTVFSGDKTKFIRKDGNIETNYEVVVATEDNLDIRRISIINHNDTALDFEVTGLLEIVNGDQNADIAHRAFYGLFVTTEQEGEVLLATRKPRNSNEENFVVFQTSFVNGDSVGDFQFETDRMKFLGRGRSNKNPSAILEGKPLLGSVGGVLDPIFAQRRIIRVKPNETASVNFITGIEPEREKALETGTRYRKDEMISRVFRLAYARNQVELSYLNVTSGEVKFFDDMIKYLV